MAMLLDDPETQKIIETNKKIQNNNDQEYNSNSDSNSDSESDGDRPDLLPKHIKTNYNKKKSGEFNL